MVIGLIIALSALTSSSLTGCKDEQVGLCQSCIDSLYLTEGLCLFSCPSNYFPSKKSCLQSSSILFKLDLESFTSLDANHIGFFSSRYLTSFKDPSRRSPLLTYERGLYFSSTSELVSLNSWIPGPKFSLSFWVSIYDEGAFVTISKYLQINFQNLFIKVTGYYEKKNEYPTEA